MLTTPSHVLVLSEVDVELRDDCAGAAGLDVRRLHLVAHDALAHADPLVLPLKSKSFLMEPKLQR